MRSFNIQSRRVFVASLAGFVTALTSYTVAEASDSRLSGRAPFGLTWGMSKENLQMLGWTTPQSPSAEERSGVILTFDRLYEVTLPRVPEEIAKVVLFFGNNNELYDVEAESNKGAAVQVLTRYRELSSTVSQVYGPGQEIEDPQGWFHRDEEIMIGRKLTILNQDIQVLLTYNPPHSSPATWSISYVNRAGYMEFEAGLAKQDKGAF